jgi:hypothetical protein
MSPTMLRRLRQTIDERRIRRALESRRGVRERAAWDPAYRAHLARFEADERPVRDALAAAGLRVKRLSHLINRDIDYDEQIPVLLEWLPRVRYLPVKETIARALTVRAARRPPRPRCWTSCGGRRTRSHRCRRTPTRSRGGTTAT